GVTLVDGVDQLERDIEAFLLEATELDRGDRGEIRVRDHVGHGELHVSNSNLMRHAIYVLRSIARYSRSTGVFMATSLRRSFARCLPSSKYSLFTAIRAWRSSPGGRCRRS